MGELRTGAVDEIMLGADRPTTVLMSAGLFITQFIRILYSHSNSSK